MDLQVLENLKHIPQSKHRLEIDFFMIPAPIQETGARPYFPYVLLAVLAGSGVIILTEMLKPDPSLEAMWGTIPMHVASQLARAGIVPQEVQVRSTLLLQLLKPLADEVPFKLKRSHALRSLDSAKESLRRHFM
jgi:hypothetical protein